MKNMNTILFYPFYFISIIFPLSSSSWLTIWLGLEINMFIFILTTVNKTMFSNESSMKYFLIQAIASIILLFSMTINFLFYEEISSSNSLLPPMALLMKMGSAPFHTWAPEVVSKFPPMSLLLFLTLQKITPMLILFSSWFYIFLWTSIINLITGAILGISESSFFKLLIYSSINNIGWMMMSLMASNMIFMKFFTIYFMLNLFCVSLFPPMRSSWIVQIKMSSFPTKLNFFFLLLSLSGLPPLMGFFPKWLVLSSTLNFQIIIWVAITSSMLTMFFYIKSVINLILYYSSNKKWINDSHFHKTLKFTSINFMGLITMVILT